MRFVAINDNFDTKIAQSSYDGYIIPLKNIINKAYSKDISRKICPALASKQQKGEFIGSWAPYRYRKCTDNPHQLEPDPETAPVIQEIFRWRLEGISNTQIARRLNERGTPCPGRYHYLRNDTKLEQYANARWWPQVIKQFLNSEVYLGHMVQGRKRSGFCEGKKVQYVPKEEWVIVHNTHEPLIDEDTFRAVRQMAQERRNTYHQNLGRYDILGMSPNILRGLIFCADCKRAMIRCKSVVSKGRKLYYVYICQSHSNNPSSCSHKYLRETQLKEVLWNTLKKELELANDLEKSAHHQLHSCGCFHDQTKLTEEMAHELIERVEIDAANRISIMLRYRDEYHRALFQFLEIGKMEAPV